VGRSGSGIAVVMRPKCDPESRAKPPQA